MSDPSAPTPARDPAPATASDPASGAQTVPPGDAASGTAAAATPAPPTMGIDLQAGRRIPRRQVFSWALWDWATQPFNTVITTFVFTVYLTSSYFLPPEIVALGEDDPAYDRAVAGLTSGLGAAIFIAGIAVLLLAPVLGQRSDASGRRKLWLGVNTAALVVCMVLMVFVVGAPSHFLLGVSLVAIAGVFSEIAGVNYNAMLVQVSTPRTIGRVSGLGWGFGYLGGIVVLVLVYVAFIAGDGGAVGVPVDGGFDIRITALACAVWTLLFSLPILLVVPEVDRELVQRERVPFFRSYVVLVQDVRKLFRETRPTFWFLLASAVFRDGLAGVFTFGAVIAATVFGFSFDQVLVFGIAANLVAGVSTILAGRADDRFGPRAVILTSLAVLTTTTVAVFFLRDAGTVAFWICGLLLSAFVGPAQAASRSFLARVTPAGREGEIFGLYATTGRAVSFIAPGLWTLFIGVFGATYWGILGIAVVLAVGLVLMMRVRVPSRA